MMLVSAPESIWQKACVCFSLGLSTRCNFKRAFCLQETTWTSAASQGCCTNWAHKHVITGWLARVWYWFTCAHTGRVNFVHTLIDIHVPKLLSVLPLILAEVTCNIFTGHCSQGWVPQPQFLQACSLLEPVLEVGRWFPWHWYLFWTLMEYTSVFISWSCLSLLTLPYHELPWRWGHFQLWTSPFKHSQSSFLAQGNPSRIDHCSWLNSWLPLQGFSVSRKNSSRERVPCQRSWSYHTAISSLECGLTKFSSLIH